MIPDIDDTVFRSVFGTFRIPINEMVTLIVLKPILITIVLLSFIVGTHRKRHLVIMIMLEMNIKHMPYANLFYSEKTTTTKKDTFSNN